MACAFASLTTRSAHMNHGIGFTGMCFGFLETWQQAGTCLETQQTTPPCSTLNRHLGTFKSLFLSCISTACSPFFWTSRLGFPHRGTRNKQTSPPLSTSLRLASVSPRYYSNLQKPGEHRQHLKDSDVSIFLLQLIAGENFQGLYSPEAPISPSSFPG